jgi:hypothetical protein
MAFYFYKKYKLVSIINLSFLQNLSFNKIGYTKQLKTIIFLKLKSLFKYTFISVIASFTILLLYSKVIVEIQFLIYLKYLIAKY